ncbi:hypothetical protein MKR37_04340 [Staphylococcus haemolyticus]|uniref:phage tail spike protein n=1 Tax=Staphylococcus haemolyticus TaxID=1283 RepID=UPI001F0A84EE|nr:phage tail spike protein [Staphylococcus haemolyticus]MCH4482943.1 hypothetical protein [Staphylococcus haemolyticus]
MIHILDFNDNIIDFINREDGALLTANLKRDVEEKTETFDFTVLSDRADNMRERNRVITQDHNGIYREFIIVHVEDDYDGTTDVQCNASYLEDLTTSKPLPPQTFEKMTTSQALTKALADTGWEVSDETEYGGVRSKSWTSYNTPYEVVGMLETAYEMVADYYIELGSHTVEHRYVSLKKPNSLFNGKEIAKGKDLTGLTRTVDTSEVRTALIALGPEDDKGNRETVIVKDDEAHAQFGLPGRYLWDVYEPESEDSSMTKERLTTLATTELNKRKQLSVSYEISALDIHRYYDDVRVSLRDIVRVKDRDFNPPLYVEAEVISCEYDMILDDTVFKFGNVVEYEETALREEFNRRLDEIRKKLNDNISNVNTIVNDTIEGELEYYERKIIKSDTAPDNPVEDMLWYDTSNPNVAVLKRYHNGEWRNETAKNVEQLGGMTREQVLYNSLTNTFQNLNIQHSKLLEEVYQLLNSEYLVDNDIRNAVNNAVNNTTNIYDQIKSNLDTMTGDTATIGKLVDTQALFLKYRERLQDLYKAMRNAQIAVEDRLKLLQSQYTDEKFNDAMNEVAKTLPNGRWDSDKQQLFADIPNESDIENLRTSLQRYTDGQINDLNGVLGEEINSKINTTKNEISANISSLERKIDGIEVGGRNLFIQEASYYKTDGLYGYRKLTDDKKAKVISIKEIDNTVDISGIYFGLSVNGKDNVGGYRWEISNGELLRELDNDSSLESYYYISYFPNKAETLEKLSERFEIKIEYGTVPTTYTLAPEDLQNEITLKANEISKAQADAATTRAQAYADNKITNEEQARIRQADANLQLLQQQQRSLKDEMAAYADNLVNEEERARMDADKAKEQALQAEINLAQTQVKAYADGIVSDEEQRAISDAENKLKEAKKHAEEKAAQAQSLADEYAKLAQENAQKYADDKVNNLSVGGRNLLLGTLTYEYGFDNNLIARFYDEHNKRWLRAFYSFIISQSVKVEKGKEYTISYTAKPVEEGTSSTAYTPVRDEFKDKPSEWIIYKTFIVNKEERFSFTITPNSDEITLFFLTVSREVPDIYFTDIKLEKGNVATDWTPAPEDLQRQTKQAQNDAEKAAKAYADAQDNLKQTETKAYADGIVTKEEQRAINDAIAKRDEAKRYAEQKAQEAQEAANQNTQEVIKPITTRVTSTESDVKVLKGQIGLMAKSDDVTQQLKNVDGRLTPLETTVNSNKATLDLLPDQINSKVSKQDYTTDQNNLVTRLNNADSERKQLSNSISDKVSLTEYNIGINGAKSYTDNKVNNINVGGRNLFLSYNKDLAGKVAPQITSTRKFTTQNLWATTLYAPDYFRTYLEPNTTYTISYEMAIKNFNGIKTLSGKTFGLLLYDYTERKTIETFTIMALNSTPDTSLIDKKYKFTKTFTTPSNFKNDYNILGYSGYGDDSSNTRQYVTAEITNLKLEKGTMATDWTPAPEDVNSSISNSSADTLTKANNYTDNKNNEVQKTLTKMNTDISQNGKDIQLRATKEEFNATNKTLSKTVADFTTNVATGMTFTYNENGTIQSMNIGNDGIKLRGDKVDITVNKEFNVVANKVDNKVGKDEVINRLNLSPEGLDIDVNKVGIRGGDDTNYIKIQNSGFLSYGKFKRTWSGLEDIADLELGINNGRVLIRNQTTGYRLYLTERGLSTMMDGFSDDTSGTLEFHSKRFNDTSRGITMHSTYGAVAMLSEQSRAIVRSNLTANIESYSYGVYIRPYVNTRPGVNEFNFYVKSNDNAGDTDGAILFGEVSDDKGLAGSGIRFKKKGLRGETSGDYEPMVYATDNTGSAGTGSFYGRTFYGDVQSRSGYMYLMASDRVRITDYKGYNNGNPNYADLQCQHIYSNTIRTHTGNDFYIGVSSNELRVTNNLFWNGGNTGYKPVRASDFIKASSAEFKHDIKKWDYDALNVISNELQLYSYKYNDDEKETIHHGPVIGDGYDIPVEFIFNSGVNTNEMLSWALRAIQQLNEKVNTLEEQINE